MRGRRLLINWQDDADSLGRAYRQEENAELRTRLHALWLLRQGHSLRESAELVGVHYVTLQQWIAWYRAGGLTEVRRHRRGGRQGRASHLSAQQQQQLCAEAATGRFRTAHQIRAWLAEQFDVHYSPDGIYSLLARLKLSPKVPRPRAARASDEAQAAWKRGAWRQLSEPPK